MLWHIGNTTVRTPYRLRAGLKALQASPLHGNIIGTDRETEFAELLHNTGTVSVKRFADGNGEDYSDTGRKWRAALMQLGFITPKLPSKTKSGDVVSDLLTITAEVDGLSGRPFEITPNGYRLIAAETVAGQQECFLRSLLAYQIPSINEEDYKCNPFSPLKFVIDILFEIIAKGGAPYLSFHEFALFVQTASPDDGVLNVVSEIIKFRQGEAANTGRVKKFRREELEKAAAKINRKPDTLTTGYGDLSIRYLKATGLFQSKGHGISIAPINEELTKLIHETASEEPGTVEYLMTLWNGAKLPTDDVPAAEKVVISLVAKIRAKGGTVTDYVPGEDVSQKRHALEEQLRHMDEEEYYRNQADQIDEILAWIEALLKKGSTSFKGETIKIPQGEAPAYFEWVIWRAFLAINTLVNLPWEARRFQIDQDFLPVTTAPGNGPDMVFEFSDAIIVVEVTLTSSSRQEAAEGEPVRRHVAKYAVEQKDGGKQVYGLFIAIDIDSNTAHTYRSGDWYLKDDSKLSLEIVPLTLQDFYKLLNAGKVNLGQMRDTLDTVLVKCRAKANLEAPLWKKSISAIVEQTIKGLA